MGKARKRAAAAPEPPAVSDAAAMDIDDFLEGGFTDVAKAAPSKGAKASKRSAARAADDVPPQSEAAAERELRSHKAQLEALKTADPEFYQYLQMSDKALLDFSDDDDDDLDDGIADDDAGGAEAAADSDEDAMEAASDARLASASQAGTSGRLDSALIAKWCAGAAQDASLGAARNVLKAFRAACHYGDPAAGDGDGGLRIMSDAAFQQILLFTLREADGIFRRLLGVAGKAHLTDADFKTPRWRKVAPLTKSYLGNTLHLLAHLAEEHTATFILQRVRASLAFLPRFEALRRKFLKLVLGLFGTSPSRRVRVQALLWLRELARVGGRGCLDAVLKGAYRTYAANAAFVSKHSAADIAFMATALVELYGLQPAVSYEHVFGFVAQLAMLLRNALTMKSADAYREVYCWKAINCLELWGVVLATHGTSSDLQLLVYPVTQLLLGAARLVPSPRWFPVRLRLARVLVALAAATRVYVPVAPLLLEVLAWPELAKPAHGSGLCPDLLLQLKLSKNNLKLPSVQQELVEQSMELLATSLALSARSPAFPELAHLPSLALKRFIKAATVERFRTQARLLLDTIATNARVLGTKRDAVEFAPKDTEAVAAFMREEPDSAVPLLAYAKRLAAKASEKRLAAHANAAAVPDSPGPDDSEETVDEGLEMDLLPRRKERTLPGAQPEAEPAMPSSAEGEDEEPDDYIEDFVLSDEEAEDDSDPEVLDGDQAPPPEKRRKSLQGPAGRQSAGGKPQRGTGGRPAAGGGGKSAKHSKKKHGGQGAGKKRKR